MIENNLTIPKATLLVLCMALIPNLFSQAQEKDSISTNWEQMHQSKEQALRDFNEAKFGMFIHWGAYSVPGGMWNGEKVPGLGEWIMHKAQIPRETYKKMCSRLNPVKFNAEEWVLAAKMAGMRYIVAMPKHHDGFAMYDSKVTDYDIMDATNFGSDPMDELYRACQKHGVRFSIYYSHATDWMDGGDAGVADYLKTHPEEKQVWPSNTWDPAPISFAEYLEIKSKPQMRELLQNFPGMQEIWYDVPRHMTREQSFEFYKLAYDIQPSCLINSRVGNGMGDFWIPGDNKIPSDGEAAGIYWETPGTLNNTWGYKSYDADWKSTKELLYWITEITSKGGNYLLNVGPTDEGVFPEESMEQLKVIGDWMEVNGESVYGTKKWVLSHEGPTNLSMKGTSDRQKHGFEVNFTHEDFWFSTKESFLYVTSLKYPDNKRVVIKSLSLLPEDKGIEVKSIKMLGCNQKVIWEKKKGGIEVLLPSCMPNVNGYVLKLEL